jgi:hypothetical protein
MPHEAEKLLIKAALTSAGKRFNIEADDLKVALDAVDAMEEVVPTYTPPPGNLPPKDPNADPDQA